MTLINQATAITRGIVSKSKNSGIFQELLNIRQRKPQLPGVDDKTQTLPIPGADNTARLIRRFCLPG